MRYWFDTEFIDTGSVIDPVSIGIISEDGRTFYAEWEDANHERACRWVKENVLNMLEGKFMRKDQIRNELLKFIGNDPEPEFWSYYGAYDWVVICQLFGRMLDIPKNWPQLYFDIKQFAILLGNVYIPEQKTTRHHALNDAIWNKQAWQFLAHVEGKAT